MTDPETYEEWRVTGQPNSWRGITFPPYDFVWSLRINPHLGDPEQAARGFVDRIVGRGDQPYGEWADGPHLHRRTVTVGAWRDPDVGPPGPKPASYLAEGLLPHYFRNDGSDPNLNACTWPRASGDIATCGYAPNAQIHRRVDRLGRNAEGTPAASTSIQEQQS